MALRSLAGTSGSVLACHESLSPNWEGIAWTHAHFFSADPSIETTMLGSNGFGSWNRRSGRETPGCADWRRVWCEKRRDHQDGGVFHQHAGYRWSG